MVGFGSKGKKKKFTPFVKPKKVSTADSLKYGSTSKPIHSISVPSELSKAIDKYRMDKNFTVAQLAELMNSRPETVQKYLSGTVVPKLQTLIKLGKILGVNLLSKK